MDGGGALLLIIVADGQFSCCCMMVSRQQILLIISQDPGQDPSPLSDQYRFQQFTAMSQHSLFHNHDPDMPDYLSQWQSFSSTFSKEYFLEKD